jgi:hypothetical protein
VLALGCAAPPQEYRGTLTVKSAQLMRHDPEVQVVADADKPLFFVAGSYWLFADGGWYRGATVTGPFVHERKPPWQVKTIGQPYAFTHYAHEKRERTATKEEPSSSLRSPRSNKMFSFSP